MQDNIVGLHRLEFFSRREGPVLLVFFGTGRLDLENALREHNNFEIGIGHCICMGSAVACGGGGGNWGRSVRATHYELLGDESSHRCCGTGWEWESPGGVLGSDWSYSSGLFVHQGGSFLSFLGPLGGPITYDRSSRLYEVSQFGIRLLFSRDQLTTLPDRSHHGIGAIGSSYLKSGQQLRLIMIECCCVYYK